MWIFDDPIWTDEDRIRQVMRAGHLRYLTGAITRDELIRLARDICPPGRHGIEFRDEPGLATDLTGSETGAEVRATHGRPPDHTNRDPSPPV